MFKDLFKLYKTKTTTPDFSEVLDFDHISDDDARVKEITIITSDSNSFLGLKPPSEWKCYELTNRPGLIFIKNPFTNRGQRYWITRCIKDYPKQPNVVNLLPKNFKKHEIEDWWKALEECSDENQKKKLKNSMRWSTLGYHHDWDTKVYSEGMRNKFPSDLADLSSYFAKILKFKRYSAEAAIVNYYPIGTTLAGHTDHSESDLDAPLFSFSFGQTAIFLIGGQTKEEKPTAMFLRSGDVTVMSKESRVCYHAVPRVMKCDNEVWNSEIEDGNIRIDIFRDFFYFNNTVLEPNVNSRFNSPNCKKLRLDKTDETMPLEEDVWTKCIDEKFWFPFDSYLKDSRININVRQVLKEGQESL